MYRKGFLGIVALFGGIFFSQVSCLFSSNLFQGLTITTTPFPTLRINYHFRGKPSEEGNSRQLSNGGSIDRNPISHNQQQNLPSVTQVENTPTKIPIETITETKITFVEIILPSITPTPSRTLTSQTCTFTPTLSPSPSTTPLPFTGKLFISQIMYNPIGDEPQNEWIELFNPENIVIDISFFKIGDEETPGQSEGMLMFPINSSIQPHQVIVIANNAVSFYEKYGIKPTYEMSESDPDVQNMDKFIFWAKGNVRLSNESDEVILLDGANQIVDMVAWSNESSEKYVPIVKDESSIERMPANQDTDSILDWIEQDISLPFWVELNPPTPSPAPAKEIKTNTPTKTQTSTATLTPSPTSTYTQTPTSTYPPTANPNGRLVISEVMFNPMPDPSQAVPRNYDVWIELFNREIFDVALDMYRIGDKESPDSLFAEAMYAFPQGSVIQARSSIVIAYMADRFMARYGIEPDYEIFNTQESVQDLFLDLFYYYYPPSGLVFMDILNNCDEVVLLYDDYVPVDAVAWGNSTYFNMMPQPPFYNPAVPMPPLGSSIERKDKDIDTNGQGDWQNQATPSPRQ